MLDHRPVAPDTRRLSKSAPFPRILCAVSGHAEEDVAAIEQTIAIAGSDAHVVVTASWFGGGDGERAVRSERRARESVVRAVDCARTAGTAADFKLLHAERFSDALLRATASHDLIVVAAPVHARTTGILLGETATALLHRSP